MTKTQQVIQDMLDYNKDIFEHFQIIHEAYTRDAKKYQVQFNDEGEKVLQIIRKYENILCSHSESGKYGKFSSKLADTYWAILRKKYPKIDCIGLQ